jgi:hypothetical protein
MLENLFKKKKQEKKEEQTCFLTTQRVMDILQDPKSATEDEIRNLAYTVLETLDILSNAIMQSITNQGDSSKLH